MTTRRRILSALTFSALGIWPSAFVVSCADGTGTRYLSIATGNTGGVYYPYGGGLAKIISEHVPGVQATAEASAASIDNLKLLRDGRADLAFTLADTLADAVNGQGAFAGATVPARSIAMLYTNYTHVIALDGAGISSLSDLRGRRVSTGAPGSGTELTALRILREARIDPDRALTRQALGVSESAGALKDGKIDAFFWSGGIPTAAVQDLAHTPGVKIRLVPTSTVLSMLQNRYGPALYFAVEIPTGAYGNLEPAATIGVANVLVAHRDMPEDLAYAITRAMFEHREELAAVHPEARKLSLKTAAQPAPAAFHPGAARFYRERGVPLP